MYCISVWVVGDRWPGRWSQMTRHAVLVHYLYQASWYEYSRLDPLCPQGRAGPPTPEGMVYTRVPVRALWFETRSGSRFQTKLLMYYPYTRLYFTHTSISDPHTPQRYSVWKGSRRLAVLLLALAAPHERTVPELYLPRPGQLASHTATKAIARIRGDGAQACL